MLPCFKLPSTLAEVLMSEMAFIYDEQKPSLLRFAAPGHQRKRVSMTKLIETSTDSISYQKADWLIEVRLVHLIRLCSIKIITNMYVMWPKEYSSFYTEYQGLLDRLQQNRRCSETRRLNSHFRELFKHLDRSKLLPEQQRNFEQLVQQIGALLEHPDHQLDQEASPVPTQPA